MYIISYQFVRNITIKSKYTHNCCAYSLASLPNWDSVLLGASSVQYYSYTEFKKSRHRVPLRKEYTQLLNTQYGQSITPPKYSGHPRRPSVLYYSYTDLKKSRHGEISASKTTKPTKAPFKEQRRSHWKRLCHICAIWLD